MSASGASRCIAPRNRGAGDSRRRDPHSSGQALRGPGLAVGELRRGEPGSRYVQGTENRYVAHASTLEPLVTSSDKGESVWKLGEKPERIMVGDDPMGHRSGGRNAARTMKRVRGSQRPARDRRQHGTGQARCTVSAARVPRGVETRFSHGRWGRLARCTAQRRRAGLSRLNQSSGRRPASGPELHLQATRLPGWH